MSILYPKIYETSDKDETWNTNDRGAHLIVDERDLKQKLNELRLKDFENDLRWLCEKINHYKKIHQRWKSFDNGIRYLDIVVGSLVGITGAALLGISTIGIASPIILASAVASIPVINTIAHGILNISVFKNRLSKYNKLIRELEDSKNKLFLFHQKALKDEVLTDDEIQVSKSMVEEIKDKILKISQSHHTDERQRGATGEGGIDNREMLKQLKELQATIKKI